MLEEVVLPMCFDLTLGCRHIEQRASLASVEPASTCCKSLKKKKPHVTSSIELTNQIFSVLQIKG